jgi:hypothetical protein
MKIIKTENGELINFAHIIEIRPVEGDGVNEAKENVTMFGIVALDTLGKERDLGIFDTEGEMQEVFTQLMFFLYGSTESIFEIGGRNGETK